MMRSVATGEAAAGDQRADMHERDERANSRVVGVEGTPGLAISPSLLVSKQHQQGKTLSPRLWT
jgi:hypothetical protein